MKILVTGLAVLAFSLNSFAQTFPIKVVFDVTSKDTLVHQTTMRHIKMMSTAYPESEFEVVVYGGAISMFVKERTSVSDDIETYKDNQNVTFKLCAETMKRYDVDDDALLSGVDIVPDGILEIVTKQGEGWGYIKESH
jgi:uncharacterized protein